MLINDLRSYMRLDTSFDVRFKVQQGKTGPKNRARALDVGAGGVKIFSDRRLARGMRLELQFFIGHGKKREKPVSALGRVIWSREVKVVNQGLGRFEVGIRFEEINVKDRDQIFQYVYQRLAAQERARELIRRVQL